MQTNLFFAGKKKSRNLFRLVKSKTKVPNVKIKDMTVPEILHF